MAKKEKISLTSPVVIAAYAHLAQPDEGQQFSDGKYKVSLLFEKNGEHDDFIKELEKSCETAAKAEWSDLPKNLRYPMKDGDDFDKDDFHGKLMVTCKTKFRPPYYDCDKPAKPLIEGQEPRSGDLIRAKFHLSAYDLGRKGKGISCQLAAVQLVEKRNMQSSNSHDWDEIDGYVSAEVDEFAEPDFA